MKKIIVFLLTALLMFSVAFADSVPMSKADQMASLVKNFLEENEFPYEYDDYTFTVPFSVDNSMVNNEIYYAQFRLDLDGDEFYISCRSCNLVEDVLPGENELFYLFAMPHSYMEDYGDGIVAVLSGGDPYEAFETCQTAVDAQ